MLSDVFNTFTGAAQAPTPTQTESLMMFAETCSTNSSNMDSLGGSGLPTGNGAQTFKFKPVPPAPQASGKKNSPSAQKSATLAAQAAAQRYEPKIPPLQLQLFLNACKLLDLALILPSDTLPIFQLHRWSFVGDAICFNSTHSFGAAFDLGTLYSASACSASMVSDINATPVSGRHQMDAPYDQADQGSQPPSIISIHSSHSASNFGTEFGSESSTITPGFDSLSLNSGVSTLDSNATLTSQPASLPPMSSSANTLTTINGTSTNRPFPNFIPHIVFLNSILNYLSVSDVVKL